MKLHTLLPARVHDTEQGETGQAAETQCECGNHLEQTAVAGVRRLNDEIRLYCVNCL